MKQMTRWRALYFEQFLDHLKDPDYNNVESRELRRPIDCNKKRCANITNQFYNLIEKNLSALRQIM